MTLEQMDALTVYKREAGEITNKEELGLTKDMDKLKWYIHKFDQATEALLAEEDNVYGFWWEQLDAFAKLNPTFEYTRKLDRRHSDILGYFFTKDRLKKTKR